MTQLTPFRSLSPLFHPRLWEEMFDFAPQLWRTEQNGADWAPSAEVIEKPEAYIVKVEVPGMNAEDIDVNLVGDVLTLEGERKQEEKKEGEHYQLIERSYGSFARSFTFPTPVNADHVEADIKDGVLTVQVMKKEEGKAAKIKVKAL